MKALMWTSSVALLAALGLTLGTSRDYGKEISATDAGAVTGGQTTCPGNTYISQYFTCSGGSLPCGGTSTSCSTAGYFVKVASGPGYEVLDPNSGTVVSCYICGGTVCGSYYIFNGTKPACQGSSQ